MAGSSGDRVARVLVAHGRVQGVGFRMSAREVARRHATTGWVVNRHDGGVELWVEGPSDAVEAVEAWVRGGGPFAAAVDSVEVVEREPVGHVGFEIRAG